MPLAVANRGLPDMMKDGYPLRISRSLLVLLAAAASALLRLPAATAQLPEHSLLAVDRFPEPFSRVVGLWELSDGSVLVADQGEQHLVRIEFTSGTLSERSRFGRGPGEFASLGRFFPWKADSILMLDFANSRGLLLGPSGDPADRPLSLRVPSSLQLAGAADAHGHLYAELPWYRRPDTDSRPPDSLPVIRWRAGANQTDTLFYLSTSGALTTVAISLPRGERPIGPMAGRRRAFYPADRWAIAPDGRAAIVHHSPYQVEWVELDGRRTIGPALTQPRVPVTVEDREAWADQQTARTQVVVTPSGSRTQPAPRPNLDEVDFAPVKPPFEGFPVITPEGELWVSVSQPFTEKRPLFQVFDERGRLIRLVRMPANRQLVGFGGGFLFAIQQDDDGLQWLERYAR